MTYIMMEVVWWILMGFAGFVATGIGLCIVVALVEEWIEDDRKTANYSRSAHTLRDRVRDIRDVSTGADPVSVRTVQP